MASWADKKALTETVGQRALRAQVKLRQPGLIIEILESNARVQLA